MRRRYRNHRPQPVKTYAPQTQAPAEPIENCEFKTFESVGEIVERSKLPVGDCNWDVRHSGNSYVQTTGGWIGREFASWKEMQEAANGLWPDGMEILNRMRRDIADTQLPMPVSRRRKLRWSEDNGDEVDNDRLRSGQQFWRESHRATRRGPATRTIVVDVGANCGTDPADILWRGAAAVALTEALESAGYRIELWAVWHTRNCYSDGRKPENALISVNLKRPSDQLEVSSLVNAVSGWFFRTVMFHELLTSPRKVSYGLGSSSQPTEAQYDVITTDPDRLCIAGAWNYEDAVELIRRELATLSA